MTPADGGLRPAVFLDRDGTVIEERSYLSDPAGVKLVPGAPEALRTLKDAGLPFVIVTNQSGVARGLYTEAEYRRVAARLSSILEEAGAPPAGTWYCPHHPEVTGPCRCRKPGTGMHRDAADALGLDLARSWYVGDKPSDVLPAKVLGGRGILVRTGHGRELEHEVPAGAVVVDDLAAAVRWILSRRRRDALDDVDPSEGLG
jgi:histidinol-phosphate phosphatase family protein